MEGRFRMKQLLQSVMTRQKHEHITLKQDEYGALL
jgi:hypothetical protein